MNNRKQALEALRDKVKAGGGLSNGDAGDVGFDALCILLVVNAYRGSLDAAKALHDVVLPGWCWSVDIMGRALVWYPWVEGDVVSHEVSNDGQGDWSHRPARAWLLAILEALISETPKGETE